MNVDVFDFRRLVARVEALEFAVRNMNASADRAEPREASAHAEKDPADAILAAERKQVTPEELHELWVEAGRPVCDGMCGADEQTVIFHSPEVDGVYVFDADACRGVYCSLLGEEWRPDFTHPTTEPLLMHLAEAAVGRSIDFTTRDAHPYQWCARGPWGSDAADTRTELALRIIIAARAKPT